ncbi:helix-turn-helix transcriptional regulator [Microbacterium kyungheense]|uniref:Regulatory LuxR family protein n=1 Tax=Microbacterium kyungheense TaxID=1263636 RepID=A0A543EFD2_9MICO|nr:LuxR family transcriptional regulator [Microbacterium kyungheense]TQM20292.1 regulatory LuxR family protein [Microbacterium kyungheense]
MAPPGPAPSLIGRRRERERLDRLVSSLRGGESRSLVIRSEAGLGKSELLDYLADQATGCRVLRAVGVESEMELPLSGLQQLCAPILDGLDALPEPQAVALGVAFGQRTGPAPDRFLVGLAALSLLSHAAEAQPLLCLVDDAQWLDQASAQVLAFVARRLVAESVGLVLAVREPVDERFAAIDDLTVSPLDDDDARALLATVMPGPVDPAVRDRIIAEAHGNPLALVELHRGADALDFGGVASAVGRNGVAGRIEASFRHRVEALPSETRRILLITALEPVGDPVLVLGAAERLGLDASAFTPAVEDELVEVGAKVRFRHPLVRSAVVTAQSAADRRAAHLALAAATDPDTDPDRRAWHLAEGSIGLDEDVAAELVASAVRARLRGGLVAAAMFHARGASLTPDAQMRSRRALMAAEDTFRAGGMQQALRLLDGAEPELLDEHQRARIDLVRGQVLFYVAPGRNAAGALLEAARRLEQHDSDAALATYANAYIAAVLVGSRAHGVGLAEVARGILAARPVEPLNAGARAAAAALEGLAVLAIDGYGAAAPRLREALDALRALDRSPIADPPAARDPRRGLGGDIGDEIGALRWLPLACLVSRVLLDDDAYTQLAEEFVGACRREGALSSLLMAMAEWYPLQLMSGNIAHAEEQYAAVRDVITARDFPELPDREGWFAAYRGDAVAMGQSRALVQARGAQGEGQWLLSNALQEGVLQNSTGRYAEALAATSAADGHPFDIGLAAWVLPEHVEAAARAGEPDEARRSLARLHEIAEATGTDWARGLASRSAALVADDRDAEALYLAAISELGRTRITTATARAHLLYGEWLRRQNRRVEAREALRRAHDLFTRMGAHAFADRAARELGATGEVVHRGADGPVDELTAQERQIARLAAGGNTNPEIGAQLFLSPRTVEWHLRKVFTKLGVTSRRQLARALREPSASVG